jgi:hypothetical protein
MNGTSGPRHSDVLSIIRLNAMATCDIAMDDLVKIFEDVVCIFQRQFYVARIGFVPSVFIMDADGDIRHHRGYRSSGWDSDFDIAVAERIAKPPHEVFERARPFGVP